MPKRPLSAYNLFFADERKELLKVREGDDCDLAVSRNTFPDTSWQSTESQQQKLGFAGLARTVAAKWKTLDADKRYKYEKQAEVEKLRYQAQMKEYNEQRLKAQQQATVATISGQTGSSTIWPAMPQTIASLGNIYDTTSEQPLPGSEFVPFEGMTALGTRSDSASGLVMPKGSFFGARPDRFPPTLAMGSRDPPADTLVFPQHPHQPEAKRIRRANSAGPTSNTTSMVLWNDDTALARRLSSPGNISILAAELGQDQVDFFLRSLREDQDKEEGANQS
jgi:HMG (high mobility group) box